jgi:hypothetical protein
MQLMKIVALSLIGILIGSLFFPWVTIESKHILVDGFHSAGTTFGKPGWFHVILCFFILIFLLVPGTWGLRVAFFASAFNIAWAVRNFILVSSCHAGVCPVKHTALYVDLIASLLLAVAILMVKVPEKQNESHPEVG